MYIQYHWMPYHRKGYIVLTIKDLSITRGQGEQSFTVSLPHLSLAEGEVVSLCGSSGCGKSTLLEMMGLILKPDNLSQYELSSATLSMDLAPLILSDKQKDTTQRFLEENFHIPQKYALEIFLSSVEGIISLWIAGGAQEEPEELTDIILTTYNYNYLR